MGIIAAVDCTADEVADWDERYALVYAAFEAGQRKGAATQRERDIAIVEELREGARRESDTWMGVGLKKATEALTAQQEPDPRVR